MTNLHSCDQDWERLFEVIWERLIIHLKLDNLWQYWIVHFGYHRQQRSIPQNNQNHSDEDINSSTTTPKLTLLDEKRSQIHSELVHRGYITIYHTRGYITYTIHDSRLGTIRAKQQYPASVMLAPSGPLSGAILSNFNHFIERLLKISASASMKIHLQTSYTTTYLSISSTWPYCP